jgi:tetratricopeptide (TPR) repeat protein
MRQSQSFRSVPIAVLFGVALLTVSGCKGGDRLLSDSERDAVLGERWQDVVGFEAGSGSPERASVLTILRGHALLALNRNDESLAAFEAFGRGPGVDDWRKWTRELVTGNAGSPVAHYLAADALARSRDVEAAVVAYGEALRLKPDFWLAVDGLAAVRLSLAGPSPDGNSQALDTLSACVDDAPHRCRLADAYATTGTCYLRNKRPDIARRMYEAALRHSPGFAVARLGLACALFSSGAAGERERALRELLTLSSHPILGPLAARNLDDAASLGVLDAQSPELAALGGAPGTTLQQKLQITNGLVWKETFKGIAEQSAKIADQLSVRLGTSESYVDMNAGATARAIGGPAYDALKASIRADEHKMSQPGGVHVETGPANTMVSRSPSNLCFGLLF